MEKSITNKNEWFVSILRRFIKINRESIKDIILTIILIVINMLLVAGINVWLGELIDSIGNNNLSSFYRGVLILICIQGIKMIVTYRVNTKTNILSETCIKRMREHTYEHILNANMKWLDESKVGDIISRINNDLNTLVESINIFITWEMAGFINFIVSVTICFVLSFKLSVITFALVPVIGVLQALLGKPIAKLGQQRSVAEGKANSLFLDLLGGIGIVKSFGIEKELYEKYKGHVDDVVKTNVKSYAMESIMNPLQIAMNFAPIIVLLAIGSYYVINGELTLGVLIAFLMIASNGMGVLGSLSFYIRDMYNTVGIASRIFELWDVETEAAGGVNTEKSNHIPVEFQNVVFGYTEEKEILQGIDFTVEQGDQIAIVGESGCGKSTILKLITAFYTKNSGNIKIFGNNIEHWDLAELRKLISYVGQDSYLFPGSILSNVMLGRPGVTEEEARRSLSAVGMADMDLLSSIGENGGLLSGGQKQRVCIARALVKNADIILLDEPTSALDTESEYIVNKATNLLTKDKTSIVITHKLSTTVHMKKILCLQNGRVVESGTFEELMVLNGVYKSLYDKQITAANSQQN